MCWRSITPVRMCHGIGGGKTNEPVAGVRIADNTRCACVSRVEQGWEREAPKKAVLASNAMVDCGSEAVAASMPRN
jgi:hypothetical protein